MTERQRLVLDLYNEGHNLCGIAKKLGVDRSTVSRTLHRALKCKCPFSPDCLTCPLPDCAIKDEYAGYVNNRNIDLRKMRGDQYENP